MTLEPTPDIRTLTAAEHIQRASGLFRTAMVGLPAPADPDATGLHEPGRTLGAFLDGDLVGTADSYTGWLTVPGGARVPQAAVTHVGVLPTHTRRGVLTALLRRQLEDVAARGEPLASLRASEAVIYERFGYGIATRAAGYELTRRRAVPRASLPEAGTVRLVDPAQSAKLLPDIYRRASWTGSIDRSPYWWRQRQSGENADPGPRYVAVDTADEGYAAYQPLNTAEWFTSRDRTVVVNDFVAHTPRAYLGLVRHLAGLDLVDTVRFPALPTDDPLPTLFTDARAVRLGSVADETWLRLVDVAAALAARTYRGSGSVVLAVTDPLLPANTGGYRVGPGGVRRTDERPDVSVGVAALAAVYLGGTRWSTLARSGQAVAHRPDALADADGLFATDTAPFAGTLF